MPLARPARPRIASAHVLGRPPRRVERNAERAQLLIKIVEAVAERPTWAPLDALLLPAGFFKLEAALGPLRSPDRAKALEASEIATACVEAAALLRKSTGALLVIGSDTTPYGGFSGDQLMAAWGPAGVVGSARKVFPAHGDTAPGKKQPYLLFEQDADDPGRVVTLPGGSKTLLCLCYDAFLFSELARGPTSSRSAMRYLGEADGSQKLDAATRDGMLDRFGAMVRREAPQSALIAVHGFEQPGGETRWQRHGIASTSAGLGGGLAVGAAHFRYWLPDPDELDHATLASSGVAKSHLTQGLHRKARKHTAEDAFLVKVRGSPRLRAVVRLFTS